jgi:hypothetical protein
VRDPRVQECVCDLLFRHHVRTEQLTEPMVILSVMVCTGLGPVLAPPCEITNRWTVTCPEDLPFHLMYITGLAREG